jgi:hypothetical protein
MVHSFTSYFYQNVTQYKNNEVSNKNVWLSYWRGVQKVG